MADASIVRTVIFTASRISVRRRRLRLIAGAALATAVVLDVAPESSADIGRCRASGLHVRPQVNDETWKARYDFRGRRVVYESPHFHFDVPDGWRPTTTLAELERVEIFRQSYLGRARTQIGAGEAVRQGVFARQEMARLAQTLVEAAATAQVSESSLALTSATRAFVALDVAPNPSRTLLERGCRLEDADAERLWDEFTEAEKARLATRWKLSDVSGVRLVRRSITVKDYPGSMVLVLTYALDNASGIVESLGPATVWTLMQFRAVDAVVTLRHGALPSNPGNGLGGLEAIANTVRFGPLPGSSSER